MITIKKPHEFEKMIVAGATVARVLREVRQAAQPKVSMKDLDALAGKIIADEGCTPSFLGYHGFPARICTSPNNMIVHGIPDGYRLREGDILSIDAGAIFEGFHGDAATTFGIGEISPEAEHLLKVTEAGLWAGIGQVGHGKRLGDIGAAVQATADEFAYGVVREYVGHGIGRQMHEEPQVPNYGKPGSGMKLRTGMAICIEPMFNMGDPGTKVLSDGWSVVTADGSLSAHFEHTVAITEAGVVVTTADLSNDQ